jgi:dihydroorotase
MSNLLIKNGRVIDPSQDLDRVTNLLVADGRIAAYDADGAGQGGVIDAAGKIVAPGLIDMHVHLREPGFEADETIESGTAAALAGGFTAVACIPNTSPPIDSPGAIALVRDRAARADHCRVYVIACISRNREGKELAEIGRLVEAGAVAFSDDGAPVADAGLMRRALEYCRMFDKPILNHAEVPELAENGVMHEGLVSLALGLPGIPAVAEEVMVLRDIALAEATGGRLHVMHVSTAKSVEAVRQAKRCGVRVTAEAAPHHFSLTDEALRGFDPNFKMNPPLRTKADILAIIAGLADGTIDAVASDHAPHAAEKKLRELDQAPFGIVGLETSLGLVVTNLIEPGHIDWPAAIRLMSLAPARILGLNKGTLAVGADADITIIDPKARWTVDPQSFRSKSRNTAFAGMELIGRAEVTIVGGQVKFQR